MSVVRLAAYGQEWRTSSRQRVTECIVLVDAMRVGTVVPVVASHAVRGARVNGLRGAGCGNPGAVQSAAKARRRAPLRWGMYRDGDVHLTAIDGANAIGL